MTRPVYTIDCETDPFKRGRDPQPFLWGFYDGERYRDFPDVQSLLRFLAPLDGIIYAHNGGKFDYCFLFDHMEPGTEILVINGRMARFTIGSNEFRDSWNILPVPLRVFGKDDIDLSKLEKCNRDAHIEEIKRYNRRDCVSLYDAVIGFRERYGTGLTLAGAAMTYWSKTLKKGKPTTDKTFYESLKKYYYGGRVECFHKGLIADPFHVVDINSAYPRAMMEEHPISVKFQEVDVEKGHVIDGGSFYTLSCISDGALPFRDETKRLTFPRDGKRREYHVTGWEVIAGLATKTIRRVTYHSRVDFGKTINFQEYVDIFQKIKQSAEKNSLDYTFAKLMQNALYGKFGSNPDNYSYHGIAEMDQIVPMMQDPSVSLGRHSGPWSWAGTLGKYALMEGRDPATGETNPVESDYINVATAASITGWVRAFWFRHAHAVVEAGGTLLYGDTDSIAYQLQGPLDQHPFVFDKKKLGAWGYEGFFSDGAIAGKKLYAFRYHPSSAPIDKKTGKPLQWKVAHKGVKLSPEQIVRVAQGETVTWEADAPQPQIFAKQKVKGVPIPTKYQSRRVKLT